MGLADRDYMRAPPRQRGRTTRLDAAPTDGVIWETTVNSWPAARPRHRHRRLMGLALWISGGTAVFTALWAIACAMIGAQWHGQGSTFTPHTTQSNSHTEEGNHAARRK
jgi:hypothetical protein